MKNLMHKPEGKTIPKSKPYVYFLAHEKDFSLYFDATVRQLMQAADCVIFYDESLGVDYDEETRFNDISEMKLVVVPVTTRLLADSESLAQKELRYAISQRITILPILQENGIEAEFNRLFGNIQMLCVLPGDGTELRFEDKLKKFLSAVFIGDELVEKVRSAFDAYIFLSYRKKDRKYARELMQLIHKNEFCRDVAIWYDEFLTPGEDFNDEIATSLEKSQLFALAVTPNLINEKNYVMEVEYKLAKSSGKPILPAELVPTDEGELKKFFDGIPSTVDPYDPPRLSESLMQMLENVVIRENDQNPEHNFFIGLAYLSGIDVEIDKERALRLITKSAEAGLPEAMRKLIDMYETGEAVCYSAHESYKWQKRLVEVLRAEHCRREDDESCRNLLDALHCLGQDREASEEESIGLCLESVSLSKKLLSHSDTEWHERYLAFSYSCLGKAYARFHKIDEAEKCYKEAISINEGLAVRYDGDFYKRNVADAYSDLGRFYYFDRRDYFASAERYEMAREIYESLYAADKSEKNANGLSAVYKDAARTYVWIAQFCEQKDSAFERAEQNLLKMFRIREAQLEASESDAALSNLSSACYELDDLYRDFEMTDRRIEYKLLQIKTDRRRYEISGDPHHCSYLHNHISWLIKLYNEIGRFDDALSFSEELVETAKVYADEPAGFWNTAPSFDLIQAYRLNAEIYEGLGDRKNELECLRMAIIAGEKNAENIHVSHLLTVFWDYGALASRYLKIGMLDEAEDCAHREFDCIVRVTSEYSILNTIQAMKYASEDVCYYLQKVGKPEEAEKYLLCKDVYVKVNAEEDENYPSWVELANMYIDYAESCDEAERKKWRLRVLEFLHSIKGLVKDTGSFIDLYNLLRTEFPDAKLDN